MGNERLFKYIKFVLIYVAVVVCGSIIFLRPHWGLMDDSMLIYDMFPLMRHRLFAYVYDFSLGDMQGWGMFRPLYPIMVFFLYSPGIAFGPMATYLLNAALSFAILFYSSFVISRIVKIPLQFSLLVLAAFFYQYDLFQHPSLQEKLVILVGSAFIQLCSFKPQQNKGGYFVLLFSLLLLGLGTKASFMIFFSMGFWAFLACRKEEIFYQRRISTISSILLLAMAGLGMLVFLAYISSQGPYTRQYSMQKILPNLLSREGFMFGFPLLLGLADLWHKKSRGVLRLEDFIPVIGIAAFLTIFLPWGLKAYIQSIIGPVFACLIVMILTGILKWVPRMIWVVGFCLLAIAVSSYRSSSMFVRLGDLGTVIRGLQQETQPEVKEIWVPCMEGADSVRRYLSHLPHERYNVHYWDKFEGYDGKVVFYDTALCPLPNRITAPPGCTAEILIQGRWNKSFRLSRFHCQDKT